MLWVAAKAISKLSKSGSILAIRGLIGISNGLLLLPSRAFLIVIKVSGGAQVKRCQFSSALAACCFKGLQLLWRLGLAAVDPDASGARGLINGVFSFAFFHHKLVTVIEIPK